MIIKRIISSYFCAKGKTFLSNEDFLKALDFFKKAQKHEISYDILIYKGVTEFFLSELENSIITLQYSLKLVENEINITDNEKSYLKYYILNILLDAFNMQKQYQNIEKYEYVFRNLKFDKKKVRKRILRWFPI